VDASSARRGPRFECPWALFLLGLFEPATNTKTFVVLWFWLMVVARAPPVQVPIAGFIYDFLCRRLEQIFALFVMAESTVGRFVVREKYCSLAEKIWLISQVNRAIIQKK